MDTLSGGRLPDPLVQPARILVVDDEPDICEILEVFLQGIGGQVHVAHSGREALSMVDTGEYDLVITDLDLGDLSGMVVLQKVRERPGAPEVIILSGYGTFEHVSEAIDRGASAYIQKPITFGEVDARVKEALAKRRFAGNVDRAVRQASGVDSGLGEYLAQVFQLYDLGKRLIATLDYQRVIEAVLDNLASVVPCECVSLFLSQEDGVDLHVYSEFPLSEAILDAVKEDAVSYWQGLRREKTPESHVRTVHRSRHGDASPARPAALTNRTIRVPLPVEEKFIGVLSVRNLAAETPNVDDLPYIFGNLAALALDNASQHHHTRMLAMTDGLTGLLNHRAFLDRLHQEFDRSRRYDSILSLIMFDIDNFKSFNDTFGHLQGDSILEGVAGILQQTSRESDVLGRYGGEEFAALLPETNTSQAMLKAERIRNGIATHPFRLNRSTATVTVSLGIATWPNPEIQVPEDLIKRADLALYRSKSLGKNMTSLAE